VPPEVDGTEATSKAIAAKWGRSEPEFIEVTNDPEVERLAQVYMAQGKVIDKAKEEREETANRLKVTLGKREAWVAGGYKISWKTQPRSSIEAAKLREWFPTAAELCTKKSEPRPLKVTVVKP